MLIDPAEKNYFKVCFIADVIGNKGAVCDNSEIFFGLGQRFRQNCTATSTLNHNCLTVTDHFRSRKRNLFFGFVMIGQSAKNIICGEKHCKTVLSFYNAFLFKAIQILSDRNLRNAKLLGQSGNFLFLLCRQYLKYFILSVIHKNTLLTNQYPELNKTIHSLFYENLLVFPQILRMQGLHIFKGVIPG